MADLIERKDALTKLIALRKDNAEYSCENDIMRGKDIAYENAMDIIARIPSVNRWIPVEDALPENRCGVIFTVDRGHPFVCVGYRINAEREGLKLQRWFDKLSGLNFSDYDVKAWIPMPDAYEPEKE